MAGWARPRDPLARFSPLTREWFTGTFAAPTAAQAQAWSAIADGDNTLVIAPTGSGKTLAAFLWAIDRLAAANPGQRRGHPGPLHLAAEGAGRRRRTQPAHPADRHHPHRRAATGCPRPRSASASAPATPRPARRRELITKPPDILITTPESLFLMLTSAARDTLAGVQTVIVDEVHAVAATKRGAHLALSLERLDAAAGEARPADRAVGDGAPARGGGPVPVRARADDDRRAAGGQDVRPVRAGAGARHGQPGEQHHLARRRGPHRRPDRGAQLDDRVRQLPAAGRATHRPHQRDSRRAHRRRTGRRPNRQVAGGRPPTSWPAGSLGATAAGPRPPRLGVQGAARRRRGRPQDRAAQGRRRDLEPGAGHRHGRGRPGDPGGGAAVGGQRPAAHRPGRPPGRRDLPRRAVSQAPHRPDRLRGHACSGC